MVCLASFWICEQEEELSFCWEAMDNSAPLSMEPITEDERILQLDYRALLPNIALLLVVLWEDTVSGQIHLLDFMVPE